jgi:hypothetical protein
MNEPTNKINLFPNNKIDGQILIIFLVNNYNPIGLHLIIQRITLACQPNNPNSSYISKTKPIITKIYKLPSPNSPIN